MEKVTIGEEREVLLIDIAIIIIIIAIKRYVIEVIRRRIYNVGGSKEEFAKNGK